MTIHALKKAIEFMGSQAALAESIGLSQPYISNWLNRNKKVPAEHVIKIVQAVKGRVTPHDLCPDAFPLEISNRLMNSIYPRSD